MRTTLALLAGLLAAPVLAGEADAPAPAPEPARKPLRGADCLDPTRARSWDFVSSDELLVDAGRRKYRVHLYGPCPELGIGQELAFKGDPVTGRLCGHAGEAVSAGRGMCRIERIELLDDAAWKEANAPRPRAEVRAGAEG